MKFIIISITHIKFQVILHICIQLYGICFVWEAINSCLQCRKTCKQLKHFSASLPTENSGENENPRLKESLKSSFKTCSSSNPQKSMDNCGPLYIAMTILSEVPRKPKRYLFKYNKILCKFISSNLACKIISFQIQLNIM